MDLLFSKFKKYFQSFLGYFRKTKVKAVHDSDLLEVLESLGVLKKIQNNQVKCVYCGELITLTNIEAVFRDKGEIKLICSKPECLSKI